MKKQLIKKLINNLTKKMNRLFNMYQKNLSL